MSHINIIKFLKLKHKSIDMNGFLQDTSWIPMTAMVIVTTMFVDLYYLYRFDMSMKNKFPITLYCDSLYSHFTEQLLILHKMPYYKIANPFLLNRQYYTSSKKKTININPTVRDWINENITSVGLSDNELSLLSDHLHISFTSVKEAQDAVLSLLPEINAYHIIRENYLEDEAYEKKQHHIKNITKIHDCLYRIETYHHVFYTNLILSDHVELYVGDIINGFYYSHLDEEVYTEQKYIVNNEYQLETLNKKLKKDIDVLPFYNLETPRTSIKAHPFHLPKSTDPILSVLIMTQLLIKNN